MSWKPHLSSYSKPPRHLSVMLSFPFVISNWGRGRQLRRRRQRSLWKKATSSWGEGDTFAERPYFFRQWLKVALDETFLTSCCASDQKQQQEHRHPSHYMSTQAQPTFPEWKWMKSSRQERESEVRASMIHFKLFLLKLQIFLKQNHSRLLWGPKHTQNKKQKKHRHR